MSTVYVKGSRLSLNPDKTLGEGGEAVVYDIGNGRALKLYRVPSDTYYTDIPDPEQRGRDQKGAALRLSILQRKLPQFPNPWSPRVISPAVLATNRSGNKTVGYVMPIVPGAKQLRVFSKKRTRPPGVDNNTVVKVFRDLHKTVLDTHRAGVVIGDFNYNNVLVTLNDWKAYLIDADSMQFGDFYCNTFTPRFVDPLICDTSLSKLVQAKPHSSESDWYGYWLMLFESMMRTSIYGGSYEPSSRRRMVEVDARPLHRISVFDRDVIYPTVAKPLESLSDEVLHAYHELIEKDSRGVFPEKLFKQLHWSQCSHCGFEHTRNRCPRCDHKTPRAAVRETIRGKVRVMKVLDSSGILLRAYVSGGDIHYLYNKDGAFWRSSAKYQEHVKAFVAKSPSKLFSGDLTADMLFRLRKQETLLAKSGQLVRVPVSGNAPERLTVEAFRDDIPQFAVNDQHLYWLSNGELLRDSDASSKHIGNVLSGQTRFWTGPRFGFGFYRAGQIQVAFVFDAERHGIKDSVELPRLRGEIIDARAAFDEYRCWFFVTTRDGAKEINHCFVIKEDGTVTASDEANEGDSHWLGTLGGHAAVTLPKSSGGAIHALFATTAKGIVRIHEDDGDLTEAAYFPDTKGFVDTDDELLLGKEGLFVINRREIRCIQLLP